MEDILVSIIIPVYNIEAYLDRCLESVVNQTYKNLEIILIDDGSTDNSGAICDKYKENDVRIKVIHKENEGVSKARNVGIDIANGEFIGFVDSDDWLKEDTIEKLLFYIKKYSADIAQCNITYINDKGEERSYKEKAKELLVYNKEESLIGLLDEDIITAVCNKLYRKSAIKNIRFEIGKRMGEDGYFNFQIFKNIEHLVSISEGNYYYYMRNDSVTHSDFSLSYMDLFYIDKKILSEVGNNDKEIRISAINKLIRTSLYFAIKIRQEKLINKFKKEYIELINIIKKYGIKCIFSTKISNKYSVLCFACKVNKNLFALLIDGWNLLSEKNEKVKGDINE